MGIRNHFDKSDRFISVNFTLFQNTHQITQRLFVTQAISVLRTCIKRETSVRRRQTAKRQPTREFSLLVRFHLSVNVTFTCKPTTNKLEHLYGKVPEAQT